MDGQAGGRQQHREYLTYCRGVFGPSGGVGGRVGSRSTGDGSDDGRPTAPGGIHIHRGQAVMTVRPLEAILKLTARHDGASPRSHSERRVLTARHPEAIVKLTARHDGASP